MMLCDWAQEINGKLYIMGGGWSRLTLRQPASIALAVKMDVPWDQANQKHRIRVSLVSDDGQPVMLNDLPVLIEGELETGRPPGLRQGTPIDAPLALTFNGMLLDAGRYTFKFEINDEEAAHVAFDVLREG